MLGVGQTLRQAERQKGGREAVASSDRLASPGPTLWLCRGRGRALPCSWVRLGGFHCGGQMLWQPRGVLEGCRMGGRQHTLEGGLWQEGLCASSAAMPVWLCSFLSVGLVQEGSLPVFGLLWGFLSTDSRSQQKPLCSSVSL